MKGHLKRTVRALFRIVDDKVFTFTLVLQKTRHVLLSLRVNAAPLVHCVVWKRSFWCSHQPSSYRQRIINCRPQLIITAKASVNPMWTPPFIDTVLVTPIGSLKCKCAVFQTENTTLSSFTCAADWVTLMLCVRHARHTKTVHSLLPKSSLCMFTDFRGRAIWE